MTGFAALCCRKMGKAGVLLHKLRERMELALLRRRQADSVVLRRIFRQRYGVDVGLYSYGCFDRWRMPGPIVVGRWCSIANTVRSSPMNHFVEAITTHPALFERRFGVVERDIAAQRPLVIEDDVWIGHNAMILPGCKHIGRGAIIGAGAVVTRDVPAYAIVAGNPAKLIRQRFAPDLVAALEASKWWELDAAGLRDLVAREPEMVFHPTAAAIGIWARDAGRAAR